MRRIIESEGLVVIEIMKEKLERMGISADGIPPLCLIDVPDEQEKTIIPKLSQLSSIVSVELNRQGNVF